MEATHILKNKRTRTMKEFSQKTKQNKKLNKLKEKERSERTRNVKLIS